MKYTIPRNMQVPDPTFADVVQSGALAKDGAGHAVGQGVFAYRGGNHRLPKSDLIAMGRIYPFAFGLIFIPDKAKGFDQYLAETVTATMTLLVGVLPKMALDAMVRTPGGPEQRALATKGGNDTIAKLENMGAFHLPGVQVVELEDVVDPPRFLRKGSHHSVLTYQRLDGHRTTYSFATFSATAERLVQSTIERVLKSRAMGELDFLITAVKSEQIDAEPTWTTHIESYKGRYGHDWVTHIAELSADVKKVLDDALERKGFTKERAMAAILERLGPLASQYRQVPQLRDLVTGLEEAAGGKGGPVAT